MNNSKSSDDLHRRSFLKCIAGLVTATATHAMPVSQLLPILDAATAGWAPELIKALPLVSLLGSEAILDQYNTIEKVLNDELESVCFSFDEVLDKLRDKENESLEDTFSGRLSLAWDANIRTAFWRLKVCEELTEIIKAGHDINPAQILPLLEQKENREKIAIMLFRQEHGSPVESPSYPEGSEKSQLLEDIQEHYQMMVDAVSKLPARYASLHEAKSLSVIIDSMRQDIAEALKLQFEDGCLDRLVKQNQLESLDYLIRQVPELFPEGKLHVFQKLAADLKTNSRQTVRLEDLNESKAEWRLHAENLPYRLGLSPWQDVWGIPARAHRLNLG